MRNFIGKHTSALVGILLLVSGVSKLIHPGEATAAVVAIGFGRGLAYMTIIGLTSLELYLGIILVLRVDVRYALWMATTLFLVFSVFLAYLVTMANPPSCGCLGLTAIFTSNRQSALLGLFRNCVILWLLKASLDYYNGRGAGCEAGPMRPA
jgi:hypothetical protein